MPAHIPEQVMRINNKAAAIHANQIPRPQEAIDNYRSNGGSITDPELDIEDPLNGDPGKSDIRFQCFTRRFPSFDNIFHSIVNENPTAYVDALKFFIDLTYRLSHS